MRIIIVGCGKVGKTIAGELSHEKHDVTVIDQNSEIIDEVTNTYDVMGVVGNGASYSVQKDAGIDAADLLIALTESDEINLLCCLFAKKAGLKSTIARVRNPQYRNEVRYIKEELGLSMAVNPEFDAATEIARVLRFPTVNKIDTFAKGRVELLRFTIPEGSVLANHTLIEISKMTKSEVLICAVIRGEEVTIPKGNFVLHENDTICIIAGPLAAKEFFKRIGHDTHQVKDTMIVGGGRIAYYLAEQLIRMGITVKIIERDRERCEELSELLPKAAIINGDSNNQDVLLEEGIAKAESFVSLTGIDEGNVFLSLFAKKSSNAKVVTKINRIDYDDIINNFNLGSIICPKNITADNILSYVRARQNSIGSNVETLYKIIENKVEALEFKITENMSSIIGIPLQKLSIKENILIGCINRNGKVQIANGQTTIEVGDTVIVITSMTGLSDFKDILK